MAATELWPWCAGGGGALCWLAYCCCCCVCIAVVWYGSGSELAQAGHGNPMAGGGIWKGCIDSAGCYELRGGRTYWYYGVGARMNMRASLGKDPNDYTLADRNWPSVRNESFGKPWAPFCFNTNFVGGPPGVSRTQNVIT